MAGRKKIPRPPVDRVRPIGEIGFVFEKPLAKRICRNTALSQPRQPLDDIVFLSAGQRENFFRKGVTVLNRYWTTARQDRVGVGSGSFGSRTPHVCDLQCSFSRLSPVDPAHRRNNDVYRCDGGAIHICTVDECDSALPGDGYITCWKTGRVHSNIQVFGQDRNDRGAVPYYCFHSNQPGGYGVTFGRKNTRRAGSFSDRTYAEIRNTVDTLLNKIPAAAGRAKVKECDRKTTDIYARKVMKVWDLATKSPLQRGSCSTDPEHDPGFGRFAGHGFGKKKCSLKQKFHSFVCATLYMMRYGFSARPNFDENECESRKALRDAIAGNGDAFVVTFIERHQFLHERLVQSNDFPIDDGTLNHTRVNKKFVGSGQKIIRMCLSSYVEELVDEAAGLIGGKTAVDEPVEWLRKSVEKLCKMCIRENDDDDGTRHDERSSRKSYLEGPAASRGGVEDCGSAGCEQNGNDGRASDQILRAGGGIRACRAEHGTGGSPRYSGSGRLREGSREPCANTACGNGGNVLGGGRGKNG